MNSLDGTQAKLSDWMLSNRLFAWIVTVLILFTATVAVPTSLVDEAEPTALWLPIVGVVVMIYGAVLAVLYPRFVRRQPHEVLGLSWVFAMAPSLVGLTLAILGAGRWLPGLGWLLTIGSLAFAIRKARQSASLDDSASH